MRPIDAELFKAALEGHADRIKTLVDEGANPNAVDPEDHDHGAFLRDVTPLMVAAGSSRSNAATVQALLDAGADAKAKSAGHVTALWYAAGGGTHWPLTEENLKKLGPEHPFRNWGGGDVERLALLHKAGGDLNECANNGRSLMSEACSIGDPHRVAYLIEHGVSVQPAHLETYTIPLFQAAASGNAQCVKLVLDQGFPANYCLEGRTALKAAATVEVAKLLLESGAMNNSEFGECAVEEAFTDDNYELAGYLLDNLPATASQDFLDQKLLLCCSVRLDARAVRMLLERGANPNAMHSGIGTALHYSCWCGDCADESDKQEQERVIDLLVEAGADVHAVYQGVTPLHQACDGDWPSPPAVRALLRHGAKVDVQNQHGQTPLMLAASNGDAECTKLLLDAGADANIRDKEGKSAAEHAAEKVQIWREICAEREDRANRQPAMADELQHGEEVLAEAEECTRLLSTG